MLVGSAPHRTLSPTRSRKSATVAVSDRRDDRRSEGRGAAQLRRCTAIVSAPGGFERFGGGAVFGGDARDLIAKPSIQDDQAGIVESKLIEPKRTGSTVMFNWAKALATSILPSDRSAGGVNFLRRIQLLRVQGFTPQTFAKAALVAIFIFSRPENFQMKTGLSLAHIGAQNRPHTFCAGKDPCPRVSAALGGPPP
jgi:hypothetical protein